MFMIGLDHKEEEHLHPHLFSTRTLMREGRKPVVTLKPVRDVCVLMLHPLLLRVAKGLDDAI